MSSIIQLLQSFVNYIRSIKFSCFCKCSNDKEMDLSPKAPKIPKRSNSIIVNPPSKSCSSRINEIDDIEEEIPKPPNIRKRINPKSKIIMQLNSTDFQKESHIMPIPSGDSSGFSLNMDSSRR